MRSLKCYDNPIGTWGKNTRTVEVNPPLYCLIGPQQPTSFLGFFPWRTHAGNEYAEQLASLFSLARACNPDHQVKK